MNTRELNRAVRLGVRSLLLHKLRSAGKTLGVLFGVSSVIAMLAIGAVSYTNLRAHETELDLV